ncbi:MAG: VCBS repeat-containing protein [Sediminicola sp.]|tara:strand:- start:335 stop:3640 length:3306 start_codon:yes stop_codon:yes gene_type:complete
MKKKIYFVILIITVLFCSCQKRDPDKMFTLMESSRTGIKFQNLLKESENFNVLEYVYMYNGGGVSIGDLNNDGLPDIYLTGNMVGSHLYINKGEFDFEEIAKEAGVFAEGLWNTGSTMADVNGDGYLDIYVCRSAAKDPELRKNLLFINNGDLTFTERAADYGLDNSGYTTQASFFDYDNDGDLDLYVLNHSTQEYSGFDQISASYKSRVDSAYSDKLYQNNSGHFTDVSDKAGITSNVLSFGLGVAISDINNDGWMDIYISNDFNEQDYLYINNKNGTFTERLENYMGHTSFFSMGCDIADFNNDGSTDILTLDMLPEGNYRQKMVSGPDNYEKYGMLAKSGFYNQSMRNMLHLNNGGEFFSEIGQFSGISNTDWSWAPLFADLDNDGFKDVFITNGYKRDYTNMDFMNFAVSDKLKESKTGKKTTILEFLGHLPSTIVQNYTYRNNGDLTFKKMNEEWGMDQETMSNGAAYADLDNDGDLDLVINNVDDKAFVYRNNAEILNGNNFLRVKLVGDNKNVFAIGAKVTLEISGERLVQEVMPTRGFQSSVDYTLVFGLGPSTRIKQMEIRWPDGRVQLLKDVIGNQTVTVHQKESYPAPHSRDTMPVAYFVNMPTQEMLDFKHMENPYNDFKREQLLPHKLSTQGPKISKADINGDGLEDFYVGGAKGTPGQIFLQTSSGRFRQSVQEAFEEDRGSEDVDAVFVDVDNDGDSDLYVVSGGSEYDIDSPELQDRVYLNNGQGIFLKGHANLPVMRASGSCVEPSDFDGDGDIDLFVGGRLVPGAYPTAPRSYILVNDGQGNFKDVTKEINKEIENTGMVTDAVWTDFNGDGKDDLIIVGEFMGVEMYQNSGQGSFKIVEDGELQDSQGWWNTIKEGDFDQDGDMDYIIGNFGLNSQLKASISEPVTIYSKDFDDNGSLDPILCSYIQGESYPVFSKDDLLSQLGMLKRKYVNYSDYADKKITDIFDQKELKGAEVLKATNFATSYLENLGNSKFRLSALPTEVQFSPIHGVLVRDFNKDGKLDILFGGNFFGSRVKYGRYDANKGLLLLGEGNGQFKVVDNIKSGLKVDGEVRDIIGIAAGDNSELILLGINNGEMVIYKCN